jgi:ABC-type enterochelin transport system permease subunit
MRTLGLLLFWLGTAVTVATVLALGGVPVKIEVLDFVLETRRERIVLLLVSAMVAVAGVIVLAIAKRSQNGAGQPSGTGRA